ncbi:complement factor H-related protein 2-like isoform X2 [Nothobranchius furzeri]|uniref:complement factor H-related protein 2-like isoform X2 n=1 Tax=Nothobranchius furzeri TaxID=105023 RepID=UPI00240411C3|nr:complement factor H-related protein 2-like isoform X2 [Nothobranchius furzeri]
MLAKCLVFALLLWIPAELHAQSPLQSCSAPTLGNGYFLPVKDSFAPETHISYSCDNGYKPAAEGWWATSTCRNAEWSPGPQCIEKAACLPPKIPNSKSFEKPKRWYENGEKIEINCNSGYVHAAMEDNVAVCTSGVWSVPVCQRSPDSCGEPPYVPNMVIINQKQQETFAVQSTVEYQCKDGYSTEAGTTARSTCIEGEWTQPQTCRLHDNSGSRGGNTKHVSVTKDFCEINTAEHPDLKNVGNTFVENGETLELECTDVWKFKNYVQVQCIDGELRRTKCCNRAQIMSGNCKIIENAAASMDTSENR